MEACTFSLLSLIVFTISRAFSMGMPCCSVISCRTLDCPAAGMNRAVGQSLQRHLALDQLGLENSVTAFSLNSSLLASGSCGPSRSAQWWMGVLQVEARDDLLHTPAGRRWRLPAARSWKRRRKCFQAWEFQRFEASAIRTALGLLRRSARAVRHRAPAVTAARTCSGVDLSATAYGSPATAGRARFYTASRPLSGGGGGRSARSCSAYATAASPRQQHRASNGFRKPSRAGDRCDFGVVERRPRASRP